MRLPFGTEGRDVGPSSGRLARDFSVLCSARCSGEVSGAFVEDDGAAHPGGTAAPAVWVEIEAVLALNWTWALPVDVVHLLFEFGEACMLGQFANYQFPHATQWEALTACWWLRGALAGGRFPRPLTDKFLTSSSSLCQRHSDCAKAALPHFSQNHQVYSVQAVALSPRNDAKCRTSLEWKRKCREAPDTLAADGDELQKFQYQQVDLTFAAATHAPALHVPAFPVGIDALWEAENPIVWNKQEHTSEEPELV